MTHTSDLPQSCPLGMTQDDIEQVISPGRMVKFDIWMDGQTVALCNGLQYDHDAGQYISSECADHPHGAVVYVHDVKRFLAGLPIID